ncbi:plastocyanin/azurin family copper-binding protein [Actinosynnema sp. NPDC020468]|uniref:plastocyanin/azurin family copper-binding protein n=1 Tax=Actinosynnema sp. NPDC020468 TaxID=3154488 RepID=UPI0033F559BB
MRIALVAAALLLTGCSATTTTAPTTSTAASPSVATGDVTVEIVNFSFTPRQVTVAVGTTVTWKFTDTAKHNVTASDRSFASGDLAGGATFRHTFDKAGDFSYLCTIHQYMTGTVTVR